MENSDRVPSPAADARRGDPGYPEGRSGPTVTVLVCGYTERRWHDITGCIRSIFRQRSAPDEVILVIDHAPELLERATAQFPDVKVVANSDRRGLSGARNTGVALATGEVVAFLDDDAQADPDWLARLLAHYRDPDVLGVGGRAVPVWDGRRPRWLAPEFDWVVGCSFTGQPLEVAPVRNMIGCNMSFRTDVLKRTGAFNAALGRVGRVPVGCEETELCIRARGLHPGGVVLYDPGALVHHRVTADRATWGYFRRRCYAEGRSKAVVAHLVGSGDGLSSERTYVRDALPRGIWREVRAAGRGHASGVLRAGSIVAGLGATAAGYLAGRLGGLSDTGAHLAATPEPLTAVPPEAP